MMRPEKKMKDPILKEAKLRNDSVTIIKVEVDKDSCAADE